MEYKEPHLSNIVNIHRFRDGVMLKLFEMMPKYTFCVFGSHVPTKKPESLNPCLSVTDPIRYYSGIKCYDGPILLGYAGFLNERFDFYSSHLPAMREFSNVMYADPDSLLLLRDAFTLAGSVVAKFGVGLGWLAAFDPFDPVHADISLEFIKGLLGAE